MLEILTVCTGNVCRSPLAAQLLTLRLADLGVTVTSAGARARDGAVITPEAVALAAERGVPAALAEARRTRYLTAGMLVGSGAAGLPDLVLAMAREHRREVVELDPTRARTAFTAREFARLAADVTDDELRAAGAQGRRPPRALRGGTRCGRREARARAATRSARRRRCDRPDGRSAATYARSADELMPGVDAVERVVRAALGRRRFGGGVRRFDSVADAPSLNERGRPHSTTTRRHRMETRAMAD